MSIKRRVVLQGMTLGGIATLAIPALSRGASTSVEPGYSSLVLVDDDAVGSLFVHGATSTGNSRLQVQRLSHDLDMMLKFEQQLRSASAPRVIGLLTDAAATLVVDMARSAGASIQWLGQHSATAGFSSHRVLTSGRATACYRHFGKQLQSCGAAFSLHNERLYDEAAMREPGQGSNGVNDGAHRSAQWAVSLGYLLASADARFVPAASMVRATRASCTGSFVSFSIDARRSLRNG